MRLHNCLNKKISHAHENKIMRKVILLHQKCHSEAKYMTTSINKLSGFGSGRVSIGFFLSLLGAPTKTT